MTYFQDEGDPSFTDAIVAELEEQVPDLTVKHLMYGGAVVGSRDGRTAIKLDPVEPNTAEDPDAANDPHAVTLTVQTRNPAGGQPLATLDPWTATAMSVQQVANIVVELINRERTQRMAELVAACRAAGAGWVRAWTFSPSMLTAMADGRHNGRHYVLSVSYLRGDWSWRLSRDDQGKPVAKDSALYPASPPTARDAVQAALLAYARDTSDLRHEATPSVLAAATA